MAKIEGAFEQIDQRLGRLEAEITALRSEINAEIQGLRQEMWQEISSVRKEINSLREDVKALYRVSLSVLIPVWVTIIGAIIGIALTR